MTKLLHAEMCSTCPFRPGVEKKYSDLAGVIAESAIMGGSRICHQTGKNNFFHKRTGRAEALCRGARDLQLKMFAAIGVLSEPTDEEWNRKCVAQGFPTVTTISPPTV